MYVSESRFWNITIKCYLSMIVFRLTCTISCQIQYIYWSLLVWLLGGWSLLVCLLGGWSLPVWLLGGWSIHVWLLGVWFLLVGLLGKDFFRVWLLEEKIDIFTCTCKLSKVKRECNDHKLSNFSCSLEYIKWEKHGEEIVLKVKCNHCLFPHKIINRIYMRMRRHTNTIINHIEWPWNGQ